MQHAKQAYASATRGSITKTALDTDTIDGVGYAFRERLTSQGIDAVEMESILRDADTHRGDRFTAPTHPNVIALQLLIGDGSLGGVTSFSGTHSHPSCDEETRVIAAGMRSGGLESLERVVLNGDYDAAAFFDAVGGSALARLSFIRISSNKRSCGVQKLLVHARQTPLARLRDLVLIDSAIVDGDVKALAGSVGTNALPSLVSFDFVHNHIEGHHTDSDILSPVYDAINDGGFVKLERLTLNQHIASKGMSAFAGAIKRQPLARLELLDVSDCAFGYIGMKAFCFAIEHKALPSIRVLNMSNNNIDSKGVDALVAAFDAGSLTTLETLAMQDNKVGAHGFTTLLTALKATRSTSFSALKDLHLSNNPGMNDHIDEAIKAALAEAPQVSAPSEAPHRSPGPRADGERERAAVGKKGVDGVRHTISKRRTTTSTVQVGRVAQRSTRLNSVSSPTKKKQGDIF